MTLRYFFNSDTKCQIDGSASHLIEFIAKNHPTQAQIDQFIASQRDAIDAKNYLVRLLRDGVVQKGVNGASTPIPSLPQLPVYVEPSHQTKPSRHKPPILTIFLAIAFFLVLVLPMGYMLNSFRRMDTRLQDNAEQRIEQAAAKLAGEINQWVEQKEHLLVLAASLPDIVSMAPERQKVVLQMLQQTYPWIHLAHILDLDGQNLARSDDSPSMLYADLPYFKAAKAGQHHQQYLVSRTNQTPSLVFSVPVRKDHRIVGVLASGVSIDTIEALIRKWRMGETGSAILLDRDDYRVIAHPMAQEVGSSYKERVSRSLRSKEKVELFEFAVDETSYIGYMAETKLGWIVIQIAQHELYAESILERRYVSLALGGTLLLLLMAIWLVHRWIALRITRITIGMDQILSGEDGSTHLALATKPNDQLGQLASMIIDLDKNQPKPVYGNGE